MTISIIPTLSSTDPAGKRLYAANCRERMRANGYTTKPEDRNATQAPENGAN